MYNFLKEGSFWTGPLGIGLIHNAAYVHTRLVQCKSNSKVPALKHHAS